MDTNQKKELSEIIEKIADLSKKKHFAVTAQMEIRNKINVIRSKFLLDIAMIKDDNGKPLYSTEQLREAALTVKLDGDDEYQKMRKELSRSLDEVRIFSLEKNKLADRKALLLLELGITPSMFSNDINLE